MLLDKTIISATLPRQTNVLWIDTSGETKVSKAFIGGKWTPIGSTDHGTVDYTELENKPQVNGTELNGNKTGSDLGLLEAPSTQGTDGQILSMQNGNPTWVNPAAGSTVDTQMSDISENPVQNKVIKSYVDGKVTQTTGDSTEAVMSQKAVTDEFKQLDETFAKKDGDYSEDGLVSAKAQNLVGEPIEITDAYTCKPTAYNQSGEPIEVADGRCEMKEIEGRVVAWNQLVTNGDFSNGTTEWNRYTQHTTSMSVVNGILHVVKIDGDQSTQGMVYQIVTNINVNHKYYCKVRFKAVGSVFKVVFGYITHSAPVVSSSSFGEYSFISSGTLSNNLLRFDSNGDIDVDYINIIDLTLLCPHLASKSNLTVAEVEAYLATLRTPQPYYAKNNGTLLGAKMLGWSMPKTPNLFNPTTGKATLVEYSYNEGSTDNSNKYEITGLSNLTDPVITFTPYTTGVALTVAASGGDITLTHDSTNGGDYFTIPSAGELTITGTGDKNYVCVKMVWDDSLAGKWFIYSLSNNEFDTAKIYHYNSSTEQYDQVFQDGILRATGDGSDAVRDRLYTWIDGEGNVKCGAEVNVGDVDLGTPTWSYSSGIFLAPISDAKLYTSSMGAAPQLNEKGYASVYAIDGASDKSIAVNTSGQATGNVDIKDSAYSDAATFKTAMSGVHLWYELANAYKQTYTSDLYYKNSNNEYVPLEDVFPIQGMCCNWSYESLTQEALDNNGQPQSVTPQTVEEFESDEREKINTVIDTYMSKAAVKGSFENLATAISSLGALTVGDFNSDGELTFSFTPAS